MAVSFIYTPKTRATTGKPSAESLVAGELWTNQTDQVIGMKTEGGDVIVLSGLKKTEADSYYASLTGADFTGTVSVNSKPLMTVEEADAKYIQIQDNLTVNNLTVTGTLTANASTATSLQTARTIDGLTFNGTANVSRYAVCATAGDAVQKSVTVAGFTYTAGAVIIVKFTNGNTVASPTLNVVDGSTSTYYPIMNGETPLGTVSAATTMMLVFTGTSFDVVGGGLSAASFENYYTKAEMDAKFLPIYNPTAKGVIRILANDDPEASSYVEAYNNAVSSSSIPSGILNAYTKEEADALFAKILNPVIIDELSVVDDDAGATE